MNICINYKWAKLFQIIALKHVYRYHHMMENSSLPRPNQSIEQFHAPFTEEVLSKSQARRSFCALPFITPKMHLT